MDVTFESNWESLFACIGESDRANATLTRTTLYFPDSSGSLFRPHWPESALPKHGVVPMTATAHVNACTLRWLCPTWLYSLMAQLLHRDMNRPCVRDGLCCASLVGMSVLVNHRLVNTY